MKKSRYRNVVGFNSRRVNPAVVDVLAKSIATWVEFHAEMYRQLGYAFPKKYDLGLRVHRTTDGFCLRLRLADVRATYSMAHPGGYPRTKEEVSRDFQLAAQEITTRYVQARTEHLPDDVVQEIQRKVILENKSDDEICEKAIAAVRTAVYKEG